MPAYYLIPKKLIDRLPFLQKMAWWLEAVFFRVMVKTVRSFSPERSTKWLAEIFSALGPYTGKGAKVRRNLDVVAPGADKKLRNQQVKRVFANLGRAAAELIFMDIYWAQRATRLEFVANSETEAILRAGKPTVFVTAHVGAWQLTNLVGAHFGLSISTVYARESNPYLADLFYRLRSAFRTRLVPSEGGVRPLLRQLQQGHSVGLAVDTRQDSGDMIPFFGVLAPTNTVAARLALSTGCPLIPARCERLGNGHFRITVLPPINVDDPGLSTREQALAMTTQLNALFEQWIREDPTQWMCLKRRWPKDT